jgi:hypothetical protein
VEQGIPGSSFNGQDDPSGWSCKFDSPVMQGLWCGEPVSATVHPGSVQAESGRPRSGQLGERAEGKVAVQLAGGELSLGGIKVAQECVVRLDGGVQVRERGGRDRESTDVGEVNLGGDQGT